MNSQAWVDAFTLLGQVVRPTIVAVALWFYLVGLGRAGFSGGARTAAWLKLAVPVCVWFLLVLQLGRAGVFIPNPSRPVPLIPFAILLPLALGLPLLQRSATVERVADRSSPAWLIGLQLYRVVGASFLAQYSAGNVPAAFAIPAGLGDVLVGALAIPVALYVHRDPGSRRWMAVAWNFLGIIDLVQAVTLGFLTAPGPFQLLALDDPNRSIGTYPLVAIPTFAVPFSLGLHALSLWQLKRSVRT